MSFNEWWHDKGGYKYGIGILIGMLLAIVVIIVVKGVEVEKPDTVKERVETHNFTETCEVWEVCDYRMQYLGCTMIECPKKYGCLMERRNCTRSDVPSDDDVFSAYWSESDVVKEQECIEDYDNLNYTTLQISEEEFKQLPCNRQRDWLSGSCYPEDCGKRNPPVCTSTYLIDCYNPNNPKNQYFRQIYNNGSLIND